MYPIEFFLAQEQFGIPEDADGILGLTQGYLPRTKDILPEDFKIGPLFMDILD